MNIFLFPYAPCTAYFFNSISARGFSTLSFLFAQKQTKNWFRFEFFREPNKKKKTICRDLTKSIFFLSKFSGIYSFGIAQHCVITNLLACHVFHYFFHLKFFLKVLLKSYFALKMKEKKNKISSEHSTIFLIYIANVNLNTTHAYKRYKFINKQNETKTNSEINATKFALSVERNM